jgi:hypothetical protein
MKVKALSCPLWYLDALPAVVMPGVNTGAAGGTAPLPPKLLLPVN